MSAVELSFQIYLYVDDCFVLYLYFWRQGPVEHFTGKIRYLLVVFSLSVRARKKNRDTVKTWIGSVFKLQVDDISFAGGWVTVAWNKTVSQVLSILKFDLETGSDSVLPRYLFCCIRNWFSTYWSPIGVANLIWFYLCPLYLFSLCFCFFVKTYYEASRKDVLLSLVKIWICDLTFMLTYKLVLPMYWCASVKSNTLEVLLMRRCIDLEEQCGVGWRSVGCRVEHFVSVAASEDPVWA